MQNYITLENLELELIHPYNIQKCSVPVNNFPDKVQIELSWLSLKTQPYTDTSHYHNDFDSSSSNFVSHSLLELL